MEKEKDKEKGEDLDNDKEKEKEKRVEHGRKSSRRNSSSSSRRRRSEGPDPAAAAPAPAAAPPPRWPIRDFGRVYPSLGCLLAAGYDEAASLQLIPMGGGGGEGGASGQAPIPEAKAAAAAVVAAARRRKKKRPLHESHRNRRTVLELVQASLRGSRRLLTYWLEVMADYATAFERLTPRQMQLQLALPPAMKSVMASGIGGSGGVGGVVLSKQQQRQLRSVRYHEALLGDACAGLMFRVRSQQRPEVYNIVHEQLVKVGDWEELPQGLGLRTTWNLLWTWSKPRIQYESLLVWQRVNHFPSARELTRKDLLKKHLQRFQNGHARLGAAFAIMPLSFVLPSEYLPFVSAFSAARQEVLAERKRGRAGGGEAPGAGAAHNYWIMKPVGLSRGRGISLVSDLADVCYGDSVVIQKYVSRPLLLDGFKFDLRVYALVTSFNPLEAFIYHEGFARLSTRRYSSSASSLGDKFVHLTNSSIQKQNPEFRAGKAFGADGIGGEAAKVAAADAAAAAAAGATTPAKVNPAGGGADPVGGGEHQPAAAAAGSDGAQPSAGEVGGSKTSLGYLWRRLAAQGLQPEQLWAGVRDVVLKALVAVEDAIPFQVNSFELFGFDVLFDTDLKPWLIEVNSSPSMARDYPVDRAVKEPLLQDTIRLVDPLPFDRAALVHLLARRGVGLGEEEQQQHRNLSPMAAGRRNSVPGGAGTTPASGAGGGSGGGGGGPAGSAESELAAFLRANTSSPEAQEQLNAELSQVLRGRQPRAYGELPAHMGGFQRIAPGKEHSQLLKLKKSIFRAPGATASVPPPLALFSNGAGAAAPPS